ncbi:MAG TPA: IS30 family transposase, partial [Gammaproteobacteria bacterium]|nr:IS30 family transposase [Gammaproteobacteria bacterium]
ITDEELRRVMDRLNNRPRKCLGMKTPNQVFFGIDPPVALAS